MPRNLASEQNVAELMRTSLLTHSVVELEKFLASRTKVPAAKLAAFFDLPDKDVRAEAELVTRVLRRFAKAVANSIEDPAATSSFLRELDLKAISRDHDWQEIFSVMRAEPDGFEDHKRAALIKYLQYLSFRKRLLEYIYSRKSALEDTDALPVNVEAQGAGGNHADEAEETGTASPHSAKQFIRLPLGEPLALPLPLGTTADIKLAGHVFRLIGGRPPSLIDQNGVMYFLREGRSMVGRHPESDIVIDHDFRDVSRAHLILEWNGGPSVRLTDLSTRGTFVPTQGMPPWCDQESSPTH